MAYMSIRHMIGRHIFSPRGLDARNSLCERSVIFGGNAVDFEKSRDDSGAGEAANLSSVDPWIACMKPGPCPCLDPCSWVAGLSDLGIAVPAGGRDQGGSRSPRPGI